MDRNFFGMDIEKYKDSVEKSINKAKIEVKKIKQKIPKMSFKNRIVALLAASFAIGVTLGVAGDKTATYLGERMSVVESANEEKEKYRSIVSENTHSTTDSSGNHAYWYDTDGMALSISSLDSDIEMEKAAYGIYSNMSANKDKRFNEFLSDLSGYVDETSYFYSLKGNPDALTKYMDDKGFDISDDLGYEKYISELKSKEKTGGRSI